MLKFKVIKNDEDTNIILTGVDMEDIVMQLRKLVNKEQLTTFKEIYDTAAGYDGFRGITNESYINITPEKEFDYWLQKL